MNDVIVTNSRSKLARAALAVIVVIAVCGCLLAIQWQLGILLTTLTPPTDPNALEIGQLAADWSPSDPAVIWLRASTTDNLNLFEEAVRLGPNDYRWHMELGRALEQDEQVERAELEIKMAVELAPSYAFARWQLGNYYLRQGRLDEALEQLRKAAEDNRTYRDQVFSLAWDYFDKDPSRVEAMAGESPDSRARLAYFFAARGRAEDSLRNWNMLSDAEKAQHPETAKAIAHGLFAQRRYPQSLEYSRQLGFDPEAKPETITNGSFEKGVGEAGDSRFGWNVARNDPKLDISAESRVKREGNRSVRFNFRNYQRSELYNLTQTVVVEPGRRYRLTFWVRTEGLKSAGPPLVEIVNANDGLAFVHTPALPSGTNDWTELAVDLTAPENCNGITIRTTREYCGPECPITGTFWYDDFVISRQ